MPEAPLQFAPNQQSGHEELAGASPIAINTFVDAVGAVRRRPGIVVSDTLDSSQLRTEGVVGLHASTTGLVVATYSEGAGKPCILVKVNVADVSVLAAYLSMQYNRVLFAETEAIVVLAGTLSIRRVDVASPHAVSTLGGTPPGGTTPVSRSVVANSSRLLLNEPSVSGRTWYSAPAGGGATTGHEQWTAGVTALGRSGFFTAEARPDAVNVMHENTNEVFLFGETSTQVFGPDGTLIYAPIATKEYGCAAPYSVVKDEQSFAWLDHRRRFVYSDGRSFQTISDGIKKTLDDMGSVDDCYGYRIVQGPLDAFVWHFPSDGIALAFQKGAGWSQWHSWNDATNNYSPLKVGACAYSTATDEHLVGTTDGHLGKFSLDASTDLGSRVPASATTGFQNQGTDRRKSCTSVRLALRRGENPSPEVLCSLQWRDDLGEWSTPLEVSLGATGDSHPVIDLRGLGTYRRRQWRFSFHGTENITLASATEEFEVLES